MDMKIFNLSLLGFFFVFSFALAQESDIVCTQEYNPVCAELQVCKEDSCVSEIETLPNACVAKVRKAKILYKSECKEIKSEKDESESEQDFDNPPENLEMPPVAMDEPGEIQPIFTAESKNIEIIMDDLSSYASDSKEAKDIINLSGEIFKAYDDGGIMLNIKDGDIFESEIKILGFVYPAKSRWTVFEASAGYVTLRNLQGKELKGAQLKIKDDYDFLDKMEENDKIWFNASIPVSDLPAGSYFLLFKNEDPSGINEAEFQINIKLKKDEKEPGLIDKIKDKFPGYKLISENKEKSELTIVKREKVKVLWLIPAYYEEYLTLDRRSLIVKDKKTPWWSWLIF